MIGEDKDRGWEIFWGVYVVILGLIFVFLVPPFQKPDEIVHWYYALALANKDSLAEKRLVDLPQRFKADKIAFHHEIRFSIDQLTYREANREWIDFSQYRSRLINPFSYLPAIIGIWIGDYFETPIVSFWLARLIGLIFFLMAVIWSIRVAGRTFRDLILMYAFLPMVLHQASSVSYDVMPLVLSPIITAYLIKILKSQAENILDFFCLTGAVILLVIAKGGYYLFWLLVLIALIKYFPIIIKKFWWFLVLLGGLLGFYGMRIFYFLIIRYWGVGGGLISPKMQYILFGQDRWYLVKIIWNTVNEKWQFYLETFLGYFGWLDYKYNLFAYLLLSLWLFYLFLRLYQKNTESIISKTNLLLLWSMVLGSVVLLLMIFDFTWTIVGAEVIEGLTGRYLLVLFPLAVLALLETILALGKSRAKIVLGLFFLATLLINTSRAIYGRYYDFGGRFKNDKELSERVKDGLGKKTKIEKVSLDQERSFFIGVNPEDNIGGIDLYFDSRNVISVVPYRYLIKDINCRHIKRSGYLNQADLVNESVVRARFSNLTPKETALCVVLYPIITEKNEAYIKLGKIDDKYLFNFLYQENEQEYK